MKSASLIVLGLFLMGLSSSPILSQEGQEAIQKQEQPKSKHELLKLKEQLLLPLADACALLIFGKDIQPLYGGSLDLLRKHQFPVLAANSAEAIKQVFLHLNRKLGLPFEEMLDTMALIMAFHITASARPLLEKIRCLEALLTVTNVLTMITLKNKIMSKNRYFIQVLLDCYSLERSPHSDPETKVCIQKLDAPLNAKEMTIAGRPFCKKSSLLHLAVHLDNIQAVKLLLKAGVPINSVDKDNSTALLNSILLENQQIFDELIGHPNIAIEGYNENGFSPICVAMALGNMHMLKKLLTFPIELYKEAYIEGHRTVTCVLEEALINAASVKVLELLVEKLKSTGTYDSLPTRVRCALMVAMNDVEAGARLTGTPFKYGGLDQNPLTLGYAFGAEKVLKELQKNPDMGTFIQMPNWIGMVPMAAAIASGNCAAVDFLLSRGVARDEKLLAAGLGWAYPLVVAISKGHDDVGLLLLQRGADWKLVKDIVNHVAAAGCLKMLTWLHEKGESLCATAENGDTPLACAIVKGEIPIIEYLLSHGVNPTVLVHGVTHLLGAVQMHDSPALVELLIKKGAKVDECIRAKNVANQHLTALTKAVQLNKIRVVRALLELGANVQGCHPGARTPLLEAVITGNREMVELLIAHGADIEKEGDVSNVKDYCIRTPLQHAVDNGHIHLIHLLADKGASLYKVDPCFLLKFKDPLICQEVQNVLAQRGFGGMWGKLILAYNSMNTAFQARRALLAAQHPDEPTLPMAYCSIS